AYIAAPTAEAARRQRRPTRPEAAAVPPLAPRGASAAPPRPHPSNKRPKETEDMKRPEAEPSAVQAKFAATRAELSAALIERDGEADRVLTALLAQEHPLLVSPPGCAKSLLLDSVMHWMHGRKFSLLLTRYTTVDEVFGPLSLTALKEDRFKRVTAGKLPE